MRTRHLSTGYWVLSTEGSSLHFSVLSTQYFLALLLLVSGCKPYTTRPPYPAVAGAHQIELQLDVKRATRTVADALRQDSLPVNKVVELDGLVETPWFDSRTLRPTHARPLGRDVVRIRAWLDPSRPGHAELTLEAVYRPLADPSVPERELDRQLPPTHPIAVRMDSLVARLGKAYGEPPE